MTSAISWMLIWEAKRRIWVYQPNNFFYDETKMPAVQARVGIQGQEKICDKLPNLQNKRYDIQKDYLKVARSSMNFVGFGLGCMLSSDFNPMSPKPSSAVPTSSSASFIFAPIPVCWRIFFFLSFLAISKSIASSSALISNLF